MTQTIEAILFDIGGTLRQNQASGGRDPLSIQELQKVIGHSGKPDVLIKEIRTREKEYRKWAIKTLLELNEAEMWTRWLLPNYPRELIQQNALLLTRLWRESHEKLILPDAVETLKILTIRGYRLGIISNTTDSHEGPRLLEENGIAELFSTVILSNVVGLRKPHPGLFLSAAQEIGIPPERCAYIGDQISRDLIGARQAGYGKVVIIDITGYQTGEILPEDDISENNRISGLQPDHKISRLAELTQIFGPVPSTRSNHLKPIQLYNAALSTMWGVDQQIPFNRTFELGYTAGYPRFELNHKISPELFKQWDHNRFYINTIHDPCPAVFSNEELKEKDYLISSLNETRRTKGVDLVKSSIDLACRLGARSVVVHPGMIQHDRKREDHQRYLYNHGQKDCGEYLAVTQELILHRASIAAPFFDQVMKSMEELILHSRGAGVELALENRYHYYDIPLPDEMQVLLNLCDEDWYGFQFDCGHAHALDVLGLCDQDEWLKRFSHRMIGTHLHDVIGIMDHQLPGTGDVDFGRIAPYIPVWAHRTVEVSPTLTVTELTKALEFLSMQGCIEKI